MSTRTTFLLLFVLICTLIPFAPDKTSHAANLDAALTSHRAGVTIVVQADIGATATTAVQSLGDSTPRIAGLPTWSGVGCPRGLMDMSILPLICRRASG